MPRGQSIDAARCRFSAPRARRNRRTGVAAIGTVANGAAASLYWFVNYRARCRRLSAGSSNAYTVTVADGNPGTVTSSSQTLATRSELSAAAGGDVASALIGTGAVVGQVIKVTIDYLFGNPAESADAMIQPGGNVSFDASCFRLTWADVTASSFTAGLLTSADDTLYFPPTVAGGSLDTLTVDYYFVALCSGPGGSTISPFADLRSGGQVKYTSNFGTSCTTTPAARHCRRRPTRSPSRSRRHRPRCRPAAR